MTTDVPQPPPLLSSPRGALSPYLSSFSDNPFSSPFDLDLRSLALTSCITSPNLCTVSPPIQLSHLYHHQHLHINVESLHPRVTTLSADQRRLHRSTQESFFAAGVMKIARRSRGSSVGRTYHEAPSLQDYQLAVERPDGEGEGERARADVLQLRLPTPASQGRRWLVEQEAQGSRWRMLRAFFRFPLSQHHGRSTSAPIPLHTNRSRSPMSTR